MPRIEIFHPSMLSAEGVSGHKAVEGVSGHTLPRRVDRESNTSPTRSPKGYSPVPPKKRLELKKVDWDSVTDWLRRRGLQHLFEEYVAGNISTDISVTEVQERLSALVNAHPKIQKYLHAGMDAYWSEKGQGGTSRILDFEYITEEGAVWVHAAWDNGKKADEWRARAAEMGRQNRKSIPAMLDGLDGLSKTEQAKALGVSTATVGRLRRERAQAEALGA